MYRSAYSLHNPSTLEPKNYIPMKNLLYAFYARIGEGVTNIISSLTLIALLLATDYISALLVGGAGAFLAIKGLLAKVFDDPELKQAWEMEALKEGENQTEFTELEMGTTFAADGAERSERVLAAPILFYDKLRQGDGGGRYVNIKVDKPLFDDIQDILKKFRYSSQDRVGTELEAERGAVRAVVDNIFQAIKETQIKQGFQETANATAGSLMRHLVTLLSRNTSKRMDVGIFYALTAGYDLHHFVNVGLRKSLSDGAVPVAEAKAGVYLPPTEHPNMYVWQPNNVMTQVAFSTTQGTHGDNINTEVNKITDAATPGLAWLRQVYRTAWRENVIPARMRVDSLERPYYILYVPGRVRDLIEQDADFMNLFNSAYQGIVESNPLLQNDDLLYKTLIIRDSKWLEDPYFSLANNFNAAASTDTNSTAMSYNLTTIDGFPWADIDPGTRSVATGSALEGSFNDMSQIARCFLLGANAVVRATGKDYALERMEVTDYGNNDGIGQDKYFGQNRVDSFTNEGNYDQTIQSLCFVVYQGA